MLPAKAWISLNIHGRILGSLAIYRTIAESLIKLPMHMLTWAFINSEDLDVIPCGQLVEKEKSMTSSIYA